MRLATPTSKFALTEKGRVGLADEVRSAIPRTVDVVLESPEDVPRRPVEARDALVPTEAFSRYLAESDQEDPKVEELFAELLGEVTG